MDRFSRCVPKLPRGCSRQCLSSHLKAGRLTECPVLLPEGLESETTIVDDSIHANRSVTVDLHSQETPIPVDYSQNVLPVSNPETSDDELPSDYINSCEPIIVCASRESIVSTVRGIVLEGKLSMFSTNVMLRRLRVFHPELPVDCRTLMHTPRISPSISIKGGEYVHIGLTDAINFALRDEVLDASKPLVLQLAIDGITLFRSSRLQLWPILGRVTDPMTSVFLIGLFCGMSKPKDVMQYLSPLIDELRRAETHGIRLSSQNVDVKLQLDCVICDAPARAFIKQTKSHSGYSSCERCTAVGVHNGKKIIFPLGTDPARTDADFRSRRDEAHHVGESPFEMLQFNMVSGFPLDYMHLICLGFCKRLMNIWRTGPIANNARLSASLLRQISERLDGIRNCLPCDFQRKCRGFEDLERWKASEYRQFFLYLGTVVLKDLLDEEKYLNFLYFSTCFYLLSHPVYCNFYVDFIQEMLRRLLHQFAAIYGEQELVYNTHCLSHLPDDVRDRGALDGYSAFPFESYLGELRRLVRSPKLPASQIFRRVFERTAHAGTAVKGPVDDIKCPLTRRVAGSKQVPGTKFVLTTEAPDNAVIVDGSPAFVVNARNERLRIRRFQHVSSFFEKCIPSADLCIYQCGQPGNIEWISKDQLQCKCVALSYNEGYVFYPLLHTWS